MHRGQFLLKTDKLFNNRINLMNLNFRPLIHTGEGILFRKYEFFRRHKTLKKWSALGIMTFGCAFHHGNCPLISGINLSGIRIRSRLSWSVSKSRWQIANLLWQIYTQNQTCAMIRAQVQRPFLLDRKDGTNAFCKEVSISVRMGGIGSTIWTRMAKSKYVQTAAG